MSERGWCGTDPDNIPATARSKRTFLGVTLYSFGTRWFTQDGRYVVERDYDIVERWLAQQPKPPQFGGTWGVFDTQARAYVDPAQSTGFAGLQAAAEWLVGHLTRTAGGPPATVTLSFAAMAVLAGWVAPNDEIHIFDILVPPEVEAELAAAFPRWRFDQWVAANPDPDQDRYVPGLSDS